MNARTRSFLSRRRRLALAWGLPLLGLAVVAGMWWALSQMQAVESARLQAEGLDRSRALARAYAEYTERKLDQIDQFARFVAASRQRHGDDAGLEALVRSQLALDPGLIALSVIGSDGWPVASTMKNFLKTNVADRDYFRVHQARDDGLLYISHAVQSRTTGSAVVLMSRRISAADGRFEGVVLVSANPAYFTWFYDKVSFGERGVAALVGLDDGQVRMERIGDTVSYTGSVPPFVLQGVEQRNTDNTLEKSDWADGRPRYLAYRRLADYPMVAIAALDEGEFLAESRHRETVLRAVFWVLSAVFALAGGVLWVLLRRLRGSQDRALEAQADFEAALDASLDAFRIMRAVRNRRGQIIDFTYQHCNDLAAQMLHRTKAEMLGQLRSEVLGGVGDRRFYDLCCEVTESGKAAEVELLTRRPADTAGRWLRHQVVQLDDGVAVTTRDVTALRDEAVQLEAGRLALQARERMLNAIADHIPALVARVDASLRYTYANAALCRLYGRESLSGLSMPELRGSEDYAGVERVFGRAMVGERTTFERTRTFAGWPERTYQVTVLPDMDGAGHISGAYAIGFDVTPLTEARSRLAAQERRLRAIADNLPVLIGYIDAQERFQFANQTYMRWLGREPADLMGRTLAEVMEPRLYAERKPWIQRALAGERVEYESAGTPLGVRRIQHLTHVPNVAEDGRVLGVYMLSGDVTELKDSQQRLLAAARTDVLTGLPNRLAFGEVLAEALARSGRQGTALSLMFLDIDRFKRINDTLGHAGGDGVLIEFASRLRGALRFADSVARLAGDEFVVLLEPVADRAAAQGVAEKIRERVVGAPFVVEGAALAVSTSIGIVCHEAGEVPPPPGEFLARADAALYAAKAMGRDRFEFAV